MSTLFKSGVRDTKQYVLFSFIISVLFLTISALGLLFTDVFYITSIACCILFFSMFMVAFIPIIAILANYYHNLYGNTGHFFQTLPVSSFELLNSKIKVALFWSIPQAILLMAHLVVFIIFTLPQNQRTLTSLTKILSECIGKIMELFAITSIQFGLLLFVFILITLFYIVANYIYLFMCISLGHSIFSASRTILGAFIVYFVSQLLGSLLGFLFLIVTPYSIMFDTSSMPIEINPWVYANLMDISVQSAEGIVFVPIVPTLVSLLLIPLYYGFTWYSLKKHTNLS